MTDTCLNEVRKQFAQVIKDDEVLIYDAENSFFFKLVLTLKLRHYNREEVRPRACSNSEQVTTIETSEENDDEDSDSDDDNDDDDQRLEKNWQTTQSEFCPTFDCRTCRRP